MNMETMHDAMLEVRAVVSHGDMKHGGDGWRRSSRLHQYWEEPIQKHMDAIGRHIEKRRAGETREAESGKRHLAHVAVRALMALQLEIDRENGV